jgi:hypothetical protein
MPAGILDPACSRPGECANQKCTKCDPVITFRFFFVDPDSTSKTEAHTQRAAIGRNLRQHKD